MLTAGCSDCAAFNGTCRREVCMGLGEIGTSRGLWGPRGDTTQLRAAAMLGLSNEETARTVKAMSMCSRGLFSSTTAAFLANVNSRSSSLYAVARPSVVCLSVVSNARAPYSGGCNFSQYFYGVRYLGHPLTSTENFTEIVPGEPLHQGR